MGGDYLECVRSLEHLLVETEKKGPEQLTNLLSAPVPLSVKQKEQLSLPCGVVMRIKCYEGYILLQYKFLEDEDVFLFLFPGLVSVQKLGLYKMRQCM